MIFQRGRVRTIQSPQRSVVAYTRGLWARPSQEWRTSWEDLQWECLGQGEVKRKQKHVFVINFRGLICQDKELRLFLDSSGEMLEEFLSRRKWWKWNLRKTDQVKVCRICWLRGTRGGWMIWDTDVNNVLRGDRNVEQNGYKNRKEEQGR